MARTDTTITPSPRARSLFNTMVARADDKLHLDLASTLELAVERTRAGHSDSKEIYELSSEAWISQASDGGWLLR